MLRNFSPEKSDSFGRVWICELGYQRPAHLPLDHWSFGFHYNSYLPKILSNVLFQSIVLTVRVMKIIKPWTNLHTMCCLDLAASLLCRCRNNFLACWCICHHYRCVDSPYIHQHLNNFVHPEVTCSQYCQHKFLFQIHFKYRYCYLSIASR